MRASTRIASEEGYIHHLKAIWSMGIQSIAASPVDWDLVLLGIVRSFHDVLSLLCALWLCFFILSSGFYISTSAIILFEKKWY